MSSSKHMRTLPRRSSRSTDTLKVDIRETYLSKRGTSKALYQPCLQNLYAPNIPYRDILDHWESIGVEFVIRVITNIA
ncbi:hypothetical protein L6164_029663 [Bauhinia variegata]|uniref:Uncharacterized protein n=1 Tax=Bauhinia variegata TaxID=167791 RepID=A0ACB9LAS7_BAUVA|nr:hypothetical protein L6164_029663 [Bauhinia variegata]